VRRKEKKIRKGRKMAYLREMRERKKGEM